MEHSSLPLDKFRKYIYSFLSFVTLTFCPSEVVLILPSVFSCYVDTLLTTAKHFFKLTIAFALLILFLLKEKFIVTSHCHIVATQESVPYPCLFKSIHVKSAQSTYKPLQCIPLITTKSDRSMMKCNYRNTFLR